MTRRASASSESFGALDLGGRAALVHPRGPVPYVPSACLMVRRDAAGDGFDETMPVGEDVDFVWRLVDDGWLVRYVTDVTVTHPARATWGAWWRQRVAYGRSSGELAVRHGERMAPAAQRPVDADGVVGAPRRRAVAVGARSSWRSGTRSSVGFAARPMTRRGVANALIASNVARAGGPLARALTRTYGPLLWAAALHPRLRRARWPCSRWARPGGFAARGRRPDRRRRSPWPTTWPTRRAWPRARGARARCAT